MSYIDLTSDQIAAGKPTAQPIFQKTKDNFADHESRITAVEATILNPEPLRFVVKGGVWSHSMPKTSIAHIRVWANMTLLGGRAFVVDAGTAGTLDVDVKYKRGGGAWTSIFSTKPSSAYTDGSLFTTSNGVLSTTSLLAGDILRLDLTTVQTGNTEFHVELPFQVN